MGFFSPIVLIGIGVLFVVGTIVSAVVAIIYIVTKKK